MSKLDVADLGETKQIVAMAEEMAPVGGIFHLAMILQDRWMSNQVPSHAHLSSIPSIFDHWMPMKQSPFYKLKEHGCVLT